MRCSVCSAFNPDAAAWCNQCFHDLRVGERHGDLAGRGARRRQRGPSPDASTGVATPVPRRPERGDGPRTVTDGDVDTVQKETPVPVTAGVTDTGSDADLGADFRATDGRIAWRCPACADWSPLEAQVCASCGTPFRIRMETAAVSAAPAGYADALDRAVWLNVVMPGLGHLLAGWTGSGLARMILSVVWLVGGLLLLGAGGSLVAVPLLLGAAVLWITGVVDGWQLRKRGPQVLSGRALLWLVIGVTLLAVLAVGAVAVSGLARA